MAKAGHAAKGAAKVVSIVVIVKVGGAPGGGHLRSYMQLRVVCPRIHICKLRLPAVARNASCYWESNGGLIACHSHPAGVNCIFQKCILQISSGMRQLGKIFEALVQQAIIEGGARHPD